MTGPRLGSVDWPALADWARAASGLVLSRTQLDQLAAYLDTLLIWNRKLSLVSQTDAGQIADKHFADSLFVAAHCAEGESVVDLGSGGGFPGLPIAIARPTAPVALIESRGAKASFLEEVCRVASIRNAAVRHARIETVADDPAERARHQVVTARALAATAEIAAAARAFLAPGGRIIAMRSVGESRAPDPPGAREIAYELPDGTRRRLLILVT